MSTVRTATLREERGRNASRFSIKIYCVVSAVDLNSWERNYNSGMFHFFVVDTAFSVTTSLVFIYLKRTSVYTTKIDGEAEDTGFIAMRMDPVKDLAGRSSRISCFLKGWRDMLCVVMITILQVEHLMDSSHLMCGPVSHTVLMVLGCIQYPSAVQRQRIMMLKEVCATNFNATLLLRIGNFTQNLNPHTKSSVEYSSFGPSQHTQGTG